MDGDVRRDAVREAIILEVWQNSVIKTVNDILKAHRIFGFQGIEANLNPKIEDVLHGLGLAEYMLNDFLAHDLSHEETRAVLNSKQCVLVIQRIAVALKNGDQEAYQHAIQQLDSQAKF